MQKTKQRRSTRRSEGYWYSAEYSVTELNILTKLLFAFVFLANIYRYRPKKEAEKIDFERWPQPFFFAENKFEK